MNQIRLHGRIVKSKEGLNEGVLNSHDDLCPLGGENTPLTGEKTLP